MDAREFDIRETMQCAKWDEHDSTKYLLSIIDAERARADGLEDAVRKGDAQIEGLQADLVTIRELARDLAACVRSSYGMLVTHHVDMTETDALLARAATILGDSPAVGG